MSHLCGAVTIDGPGGVLRACFFCGVDSTALVIFLGIMVGASVLGMVAFMAWGLSTGHLRRDKELARRALEAQGPDLVREEDLP